MFTVERVGDRAAKTRKESVSPRGAAIKRLRARLEERESRGSGRLDVRRESERQFALALEVARIRTTLDLQNRARPAAAVTVDRIVREYRTRTRQLPPRTVATFCVARFGARRRGDPNQTLRPNVVDRSAARFARSCDFVAILRTTTDSPAVSRILDAVSPLAADREMRLALAGLVDQTLHKTADRLAGTTAAADLVTLRGVLQTATAGEVGDRVALLLDHWEATIAYLVGDRRRWRRLFHDSGVVSSWFATERAVQIDYIAAIAVAAAARFVGVGVPGDDEVVVGAGDGKDRDTTRDQISFLVRLNRAQVAYAELLCRDDREPLGPNLGVVFRLSVALSGFDSIALAVLAVNLARIALGASVAFLRVRARVTSFAPLG